MQLSKSRFLSRAEFLRRGCKVPDWTATLSSGTAPVAAAAAAPAAVPAGKLESKADAKAGAAAAALSLGSPTAAADAGEADTETATALPDADYAPLAVSPPGSP